MAHPAILLVALEAFHGKDWNDGLSRQRREATESAVRLMLEGYEPHLPRLKSDLASRPYLGGDGWGLHAEF